MRTTIRRRPSPTNATKANILRVMNGAGHLAWSNNTVGIYDAQTGRYRTNFDHNAKGSGDIIVCLKGGRYLELEVKTGRDKQRESQVLHEQKVKARGGLYFIVRDTDGFLALAKQEGWI